MFMILFAAYARGYGSLQLSGMLSIFDELSGNVTEIPFKLLPELITGDGTYFPMATLGPQLVSNVGACGPSVATLPAFAILPDVIMLGCKVDSYGGVSAVVEQGEGAGNYDGWPLLSCANSSVCSSCTGRLSLKTLSSSCDLTGKKCWPPSIGHKGELTSAVSFSTPGAIVLPADESISASRPMYQARLSLSLVCSVIPSGTMAPPPVKKSDHHKTAGVVVGVLGGVLLSAGVLALAVGIWLRARSQRYEEVPLLIDDDNT